MSEKTVLLKDMFDEAMKKQRSRPKSVICQRHLPKDRYKTGFFNTSRIYCQSCKQKFTYQYHWFDFKQDKKRYINSIDFMKLRKKVKDNGLRWEVDNYHFARKTAREVGLPLKDLQ